MNVDSNQASHRVSFDFAVHVIWRKLKAISVTRVLLHSKRLSRSQLELSMVPPFWFAVVIT